MTKHNDNKNIDKPKTEDNDMSATLFPTPTSVSTSYNDSMSSLNILQVVDAPPLLDGVESRNAFK